MAWISISNWLTLRFTEIISIWSDSDRPCSGDFGIFVILHFTLILRSFYYPSTMCSSRAQFLNWCDGISWVFPVWTTKQHEKSSHDIEQRPLPIYSFPLMLCPTNKCGKIPANAWLLLCCILKSPSACETIFSPRCVLKRFPFSYFGSHSCCSVQVAAIPLIGSEQVNM